jgi:hypothetical protein
MVPRELAKHPLDEQTILFFFDKDMKTFLIYQIFFQLFFIFVVCKGFEPIFLPEREVSCLSLSQDKHPLDEHTAEIILK